MKPFITKGATDQTVYVFIPDSSSTTGAGLTGLVYNSASLSAYYVRPGASATQITLASQTVTGAHTDGGFVEVSSSNMPGWYRLDLPDAVAASGVNSVGLQLKGAANMAPVNLEIPLTSINLQDAVRMGLTALPNANAEANGGLYTRGTGAGQINQAANGQIDVNGVALAANVITATAINADALTAAKFAADVTTELQNGLATGSSITTLQEKILAYFQLALRKDGAIATDRATELAEINANEGTGAGAYANTSDSQEATVDGAATIDDVVAATGRVNSFTLSGVQRAVPLIRFFALESFATGQALTNPTIASGDWKISKDGGAFANLATLPDVEPDGTNQVRFQFSESELDADQVVILGIDQTATKEWRDTMIIINITGQTVKVVTDGSNAAGTFKISTFGMGTEATDMLKPAYLKALTGALKGQVQKVTTYNTTTDFVTVSPAFPSTPADGVYFQVVNG